MRASLTSLVVACALACGDATGSSAASPVGGAWLYGGTQTTPSSAQLSGSLTWRGVASTPGGFEGTFVLTEVGLGGQPRTLAGTSAGQIVADTIATFDLLLDSADRLHIGVFRGDSIVGTWAETGATGASGHFVMHRGTESAK